jgi:hypothetical protein
LTRDRFPDEITGLSTTVDDPIAGLMLMLYAFRLRMIGKKGFGLKCGIKWEAATLPINFKEEQDGRVDHEVF